MNYYNYNELKRMYKEDYTFSTCNIDLLITPSIFDGNIIYELIDIKTKFPSDVEVWTKMGLDDYLKNVIDLINKFKLNFSYSNSHNSWSIFYSIKEIVDIINDCPKMFETYFRGQNGSWELIPTLFRENYNNDYRENFESIYKDISKRYPDKIKYFPIDMGNLDDRSNNLSELQHYGIGTPLVDITRNPFIAMLFMVEGYENVVKDDNYNNPQLDVFFVKNDGNNLLFQKSTKSKYNLRIDAQQGAFLNFDKLFDNNGLCHPNGFDKICKISIRVKLIDSINSFVLDKIDKENDNNAEKKSSITEYTNEQCALLTAVKDIKEKLSSYYYLYDSLFPDFYMYLKHIKNSYKNNSKYDNSKEKWYVTNRTH